ncbi:LLM class flavin-dependent oxidoreductase [Nocardioides sp. CER19]|uniref:LLM class flavin-dependent oxidoreductase n=1 Tax=Nocardioides sp. CER19 TaxID=3038538 RepID=UPI00244C01B8|nr:LLM class flavin-dependent oxidoreductase [Nocardioides sp. CER19]MDH2412882.1 LLM class flavin-dependent oxidoreductase [Nocardioides sp. CER19]
MKFSLWPNAARPAGEILTAAREADAAGWFGVWVADHYMPNTGDTSFAPGDTHEAWGLLPAIAATTERVRVGTLVSPTSVHHPALLANRAATIDHVSEGRMVLGLGAGWQINEHAAYGIDLEAPGRRVTRFEESIQIVRSLLSEQATTFHGEVFTITDAPCDPKPVQERLPILVGTGSPRMLRITARYADEWNTWGTPESAGAVRVRLLEACDRVGRDPATVWCSVNAMVDLDGETPAPGRPHIAGSAEQLVDLMGAYAEAGFDEFNLPDGNLGAALTERSDRVARFKSEVIDRLG